MNFVQNTEYLYLLTNYICNKIRNVYLLLSCQLKLTAARLKKGTAQWFMFANSARIFINLSWYDYTT